MEVATNQGKVNGAIITGACQTQAGTILVLKGGFTRTNRNSQVAK